jgi:hypothetical protein
VDCEPARRSPVTTKTARPDASLLETPGLLVESEPRFPRPPAARLLTGPPIAPIMRSMALRVDASEGLSRSVSHYNSWPRGCRSRTRKPGSSPGFFI